MTPTQPTPEEQVEALHSAHRILDNATMYDDDAIEVAEAVISLLTRQSQERAEIKRLNRALFVAGKRITADEAELDRAVEREVALYLPDPPKGGAEFLDFNTETKQIELRRPGAKITGPAHIGDGWSVVAASPGKGAEGEAGDG